MSEKLLKIIRDEIENKKFAAGANVLILKDGKELAYAEYG